MSYTLTQLRGFATVAEELHFGRAAERLNMTQPPLTRQIQGLERIIGAQLIDRSGREITLTAAGETFLADARRILALTEAAPLSARRVAAGQIGTLRIGFTAIGAYAVLGEVLTAISDALPQVHIALAEEVSEVQTEQLSTGMLDLAVIRPPVPLGLESFLLHEEDLVLALPAGHRLADEPGPISLGAIADDYIGYSPEGSRYLHDVCAALVGVAEFLRTQIASQVPTMLALVRAGRGIALIPRSCTAMGVDQVTYRELEPSDSRTVRLHLAWHRDTVNPITRRAAEILRTAPSPDRT